MIPEDLVNDRHLNSHSDTSYRTSRRAREEQRRDSVNASKRTFPEQPVPLILKKRKVIETD